MQLSEYCKKAHLDFDKVSLHQRRIKQLLEGSSESKVENILPIIETCRFDNGLIIKLPNLQNVKFHKFKMAAFTPAAGAASRYFNIFTDFIDAAESLEVDSLVGELNAFFKEGALDWPIPSVFRRLIMQRDQLKSIDFDQLKVLVNSAVLALKSPKLLQPCVVDDLTFLQLKQAEMASIEGIDEQYFVIQPDHEKLVRPFLKDNDKILFQDAGLSTIRFDGLANPIIENNCLSIVPAGHGALADLFSKVENADSVFIKNVDNVVGNSPKVIQATNDFLNTHQLILATVKEVRRMLLQDNLEGCFRILTNLLDDLELNYPTQSLKPQNDVKDLWDIVDFLFYATERYTRDLAGLKSVFDRPVNTMGMVPNSGTDVGGTPCIVSINGSNKRICLEVPHASQSDQSKWLEDPAMATHFNPVFVCAEIPRIAEYYTSQTDEFWLLAKKTFKGERVYYHELALYELLSHSDLTNTVFVEIPRFLFNPHKSLKDASGISSSHWIK